MGTIVFFGSGPVAAKSLELLLNDFEIEAVVTKPKPKHHKGSFPVLDVAETHNLPLITAKNKQELTDTLTKQKLKSEVGVLIDFGIIVSNEVIDYFPLGIINSHFSILPEWRGADPITFAILSGQKTTGISLMRIVEKMDEGPLLAYGEYELPPKITGPQLTNQLIKFSYTMLKKELPRYNKDLKLAPQSVTGREVSYSRKLTKQDGVIDWQKPAYQIEREIRAFIEWPKSKTTIFGRDVILTEAQPVPTDENNTKKPGTIIINDETKQLSIITSDGTLLIHKIKPVGKNEISAPEFIRNYSPKNNQE